MFQPAIILLCFLSFSSLFVNGRVVVHDSRNLQNSGMVPTDGNYDIKVTKQGATWWTEANRTRYHCTFRNLWTKQRHPKDYPNDARWSPVVLYSHTLQYEPWRAGEKVTRGIEKIVEDGFTDTFEEEIEIAGEQCLSFQSSGGTGFYTTQQEYINVPGIDVNYNYPYLSGLSGMSPSPDWFTGFYSYFTIDEYQRTFYDRFIIQMYPFDAGTDEGTEYTAKNDDQDPPESVRKFTAGHDGVEEFTYHGIYLSPDGSAVLPVAEFDCQMHVGEEVFQPPDCDYLKYPNCPLEECMRGDETGPNGEACNACDPDVPSCGVDPGLSPAASVFPQATTILMVTTTSVILGFLL